MAEKSDFIGNAKVVTTKFGDLYNLGFNRDHLNQMLNTMDEEGIDWFNIKLTKSKNGNPYMVRNDWKPDAQPPVNGGHDEAAF